MDEIATTPTTPVRKRGCILGTAPTYKLAPWQDLTVDIFGLNDGYVLPGVSRATGWMDLHPVSEMVFRTERVVAADQVPVGAYLRPAGHLDWLKTRPFPVYLHSAHPEWPTAQAFPFDTIRQQYGDYFSSTPAWMLAWMLLQGYTEIHIYGIHLATQWEYIQQRPNMEFLIGMALARGVQFVIPEQSTLLKGKHVYALQPKPGLSLQRVEQQAQAIKARGRVLKERLATVPWYARGVVRSQLHVLDLELADARQELGRLQSLAAVT